MKKIIVLATFIFLTCGLASAQTSAREILEKVRQIKILESDRDDVKRILKGFEASDDEDYLQDFSKDGWDIDVTYASGNCFRDEDEDSDGWKVSEWKVVRIEIDPPGEIEIEDAGFDLAKYKKEQVHANVESLHIYHDKSSGISFEVNEDELDEVIFFPSGDRTPALCDNNEEAKKFYANESWFDEKLEDRVIRANPPPAVTELKLSASEIIIGCDIAKNKNCSESSKEIQVATVALDAENDVLTYNYVVSGGRIVGQGARVVWDLTGVEPGTYTITAGVDDGCGVCGTTKTQTVIVKKCAGCGEK